MILNIKQGCFMKFNKLSPTLFIFIILFVVQFTYFDYKFSQQSEELFDLQLGVIRCINYGLEIINNEARQRFGLLEEYVERINYEYENNFLGIDAKKDSLNLC